MAAQDRVGSIGVNVIPATQSGGSAIT